MGFFRQTDLADIDALMDLLDTEFVAEGLDQDVISSLAVAPSTNRAGREIHYRFPGETGAGKNHCGIRFGMMRFKTSSYAHAIAFFTYLGRKLYDLASVSVTGTTATANTTGSNGLAVGDLVAMNGTNNGECNQGFSGPGSAPGLVTNIDSATQFRCQLGNAVTGTQASTGGKAVAMYNFNGYRNTQDGGQDGLLVLNDAPMACFGRITKFGAFILVKQGGIFQPITIGQCGRDHVKTSWRRVSESVSPAVGMGAGVPVTIPVDRTVNDKSMEVGQKVHLVPPGDAGPGGGACRDLVEAEIISFPAAAQIEVDELPSGYTFGVGTVVGYDPCPQVLQGSAGASNADLASKTWFMCHKLNGARVHASSPIGGAHTLDVDNGEPVNPDLGTIREMRERHHRLELASSGSRHPLPGVTSWPSGYANEGNIVRTGHPTDAPAGDYMIFDGQAFGTGGVIGIGDEAA